MRHANLIEPRHPRPSRVLRHALLLLALGLAIVAGLLLSDVEPSSAATKQLFPEPRQSPSFMPETVRLRTDQ